MIWVSTASARIGPWRSRQPPYGFPPCSNSTQTPPPPTATFSGWAWVPSLADPWPSRTFASTPLMGPAPSRPHTSSRQHPIIICSSAAADKCRRSAEGFGPTGVGVGLGLLPGSFGVGVLGGTVASAGSSSAARAGKGRSGARTSEEASTQPWVLTSRTTCVEGECR